MELRLFATRRPPRCSGLLRNAASVRRELKCPLLSFPLRGGIRAHANRSPVPTCRSDPACTTRHQDPPCSSVRNLSILSARASLVVAKSV